MAVAGEVTWYGWAHPYLWSIPTVSLSGLELWQNKPQKWVESELLGHVPWCTWQARVSHTSAWYKGYVRPGRITWNFLAAFRRFRQSVLSRKIWHWLQGYPKFDQYSLCWGIFSHWPLVAWCLLTLGIIQIFLGINLCWYEFYSGCLDTLNRIYFILYSDELFWHIGSKLFLC